MIHELIGGVNRIDFETAPQLESKTEQLLASGRYREGASAALGRARQNVREELSQRSHTSMEIATRPSMRTRSELHSTSPSRSSAGRSRG